MKINKYYDPDPAGGNGGGDPKDPDLEKFEAFEGKGYDNLNEQEKKDYDTLKGKFEVQYVGADGKPLTADQIKVAKEVETKVNAISAKAEKDRTPEELKFLKDNTDDVAPDLDEEVKELTGFDYSIDYGQVDPKSAQGRAKREMTIHEMAQKEYDTELREKYPEGYRYLEFIQRGGKSDDYFKPENRDWKSITVTNKTDLGVLENVYRQALELKGNKPAHIDFLIQGAKDKGKLFEEAKSELEVLQQRQEAVEQKTAKDNELAEEMEARATDLFFTNLTKELDKGINGNPLSAKDKREFFNFLGSSVKFSNGKFFSVREIDPSKIDKEIGIEFFRFRGGDLKQLVEKKAKTNNAIKIKNGLSIKVVPKGQGNGSPKNYVPLGSL